MQRYGGSLAKVRRVKAALVAEAHRIALAQVSELRQ
jgi:hypothetical protein